MTETAIRISDLSKSYRIKHEAGNRATNLGEAISNKIRNPFEKATHEEFWALQGIDLEINKGDVVGVIGRNGAGKSTLLKVLSRITEPTTGKVELFGRIGSLLEVGTGFHPELTGRENIYLNGAILGMRRPEITRQFDAIVDFAGVEKFLDTPVKRYSSGMYVRLAFAVAAHLNPEILIVDEVLAVGDAEFQKKCLGKMQDVAESGRTVLFVSHNMAAVQALCNSAVLLRRGAVEFTGDVATAIDKYSGDSKELGAAVSRQSPFGKARVIEKLIPARNRFPARTPILIDVHLSTHDPSSRCHFSLHVYNNYRENVITISSEHLDTGQIASNVESFSIQIDSPILLPGIYDIDAFLYSGGIIDHWPSAARFEVTDSVGVNGYNASSQTGCKMCLSDFSFSDLKVAQCLNAV
ncbi:ABC transporter ATP-binding protein [Rhodopirellula sallentina]|uniref:Polysaccharide ABC transporter ATP-binding protein n=1 Tax=Rhodopirellula sallentina SM41 TaxID=1263870 RepID=M5U4V6_9BACT|nr:polysaccharide ABC transporter ATP-binding protein [Rhodopirellula sallentina]EMI56492.1 polysaccharide ABC transporter ATP-binding protein [Rhodopirellula sallentina SM41]